jgi:polysaccharide chain length determinant protein (PEP-CTERM system associated)
VTIVNRSPQNLDLALEAWRRRKWLAVTVFAAVAGAAGTVAESLPNLYRAATTVIVERQEVSEAFVRPSVTAELDTRLQTIREAVMSRTQLADLIQRLGLYPDLRSTVPIEDLVGRMRRELELDIKGVESQMSGRTSTIAFTISYSGRDPGTVARVANELARMYVERNTTLRAGQASKTAAFLKAQLDDARKELDTYEQRQNDFKLSHIGELPQQVDANLASLERLNTQLRLNGESQLRLLDRRDRLERQRLDAAAAPRTVALSPEAERLAKLSQQLADLRKQFTDEYPDVVRLRAEIDGLNRVAAQQPAQPRTESGDGDAAVQARTALADVTTELRALKDEEHALRQSIVAYQERVENVPKRQQELQDLSRDYGATKERYDSLAKRYEEAQLAESLEQGRDAEQFRILDPAIPPRAPVAPVRFRILVVGLALSIGLAVAAVIAAEKLDTTFHSVEEVRAYVGLPTLASVPLIASRALTWRKRRRAAVLGVSVAVGLTLILAGSRHLATGNEQLVRMMERSRG